MFNPKNIESFFQGIQIAWGQLKVESYQEVAYKTYMIHLRATVPDPFDTYMVYETEVDIPYELLEDSNHLEAMQEEVLHRVRMACHQLMCSIVDERIFFFGTSPFSKKK